MFTKRSLILVATLMLALLCAGTVSTFAATANSAARRGATHYVRTGIPAISVRYKTPEGLLNRAEIIKYLNRSEFAGGATVTGLPPVIQDLELTDWGNLNNLGHILIPDIPKTQKVFFVKMTGPFTLFNNPPLPVLTTLVPGPDTLPLLTNLHTVPVLGSVANFGSLAGLGDLSGLSSFTALGDLTVGLTHVLKAVFEIFDAHSGNLLAWGV